MRTIVASLALGGMMILAAPAATRAAEDAEHVTNEPAATLLLPYFEAEVPKKIGGKGKGINTLFTIQNTSASAAVAKVTIWSDLGIPVFNFDVYLTGFDYLRISMQDVLNGVLPLTADDGADPGDTFPPDTGISNQGNLSQDINFPGASGPCGSASTLYSEPLPDASILHIRSALTGKFSALLNGCFGIDYGEKKPIARGYVTIDSVTQCSELFPDDPGYASGGVLDGRNILTGEYLYVDAAKKVGRGDALVHVRHAGIGLGGNDPQVTGAGEYTFYTRFEGTAGASNRQPLGSKFAAPYVNRAKDKWFPQGTSLIVWRDPKLASTNPIVCGTRPPWFPLGQEEVLAFDHQENVEQLDATLVGLQTFAAAAQKVKVDGPTLPISFDEGWLYLNLNTSVPNVFLPAEDPAAAQAWVTVVKDSKGKFSVGTRAIMIESATETSHTQLAN